MLERFCFTPRVFDVARASSLNAMELGIGCLKDLCQEEGLFLNLCDGLLGRVAGEKGISARAFLEFAWRRKRLVEVRSTAYPDPDGDEEWLWEALNIHQHNTTRCRAIITEACLAGQYRDGVSTSVVSLEEINRSPWWRERSPSRGVKRTTKAYLHELDLLLKHADLLMFIERSTSFLVTDMAAISLPNGFDIGSPNSAMTTWTRVGRKDQERLQREFSPEHPDSSGHEFVDRFEIGAV